MIYFLLKNNKDERQYREFQKYFDEIGVNYHFLYSIKELNMISNNEKDSIICSDPRTVILLKILKFARFKKYSIFYRSRGLSPEESYFKTNSRLKYIILTIIEYFSILFSDKILLISKEHKKFIQQKYKIKKEMDVIHNYNLNFNYPIVKKNRTKGYFNICYSGSVSKWQNIDIVLHVFRNLHLLNNNLKFYFLTDQISKVSNEIINKYKFINFISCDEVTMEENLCKMDLGVIIRDDISVNRVASPFKIMDYLNAGLRVISTDNIGDYFDLFKDNKLFFFDSIDNFKNGMNILQINEFVNQKFNERVVLYSDLNNKLSIKKEFDDFFLKREIRSMY